MVYRRAVLAFAVAALFFAPPAARSDDIDDLKAAFEQEAQAFNARDLNAIVASAHDHIVLFGQFPPFSVEGKEAYRQRFQTMFAKHQNVTFTPFDPQFLVSGNLGVAWGHDKIVLKPKDGSAETYSGRFTFVYTKVDGKWLRLVAHASPEPPPPATP